MRILWYSRSRTDRSCLPVEHKFHTQTTLRSLFRLNVRILFEGKCPEVKSIWEQQAELSAASSIQLAVERRRLRPRVSQVVSCVTRACPPRSRAPLLYSSSFALRGCGHAFSTDGDRRSSRACSARSLDRWARRADRSSYAAAPSGD
jgi:hypothetical protein